MVFKKHFVSHVAYRFLLFVYAVESHLLSLLEFMQESTKILS